jgi:YHS domain-containing protein
MIQVWEVDQYGNIIETYLWTQEEIDGARSNGRKIVDFPWGESFLSPKFDLVNNKWVEGKSSDELLNMLRQNKMDELNSACNNAIYGRFASTFNGKTYYFSCDSEAQSNFEKVDRAFEKGRITQINWTAYDESDNVVRLTYDTTSFETLYVDHLNHIQSNISKLRDTLMPQVENASEDELKQINW